MLAGHAPAHCQATQQFVAQALCLCHGAQAPVGHLLSVQLDGVLGEVEALLHGRGQLTDAAALLACRAGRARQGHRVCVVHRQGGGEGTRSQ